MPSMIQIIKKAAIEAVEASNPTKLIYGTVRSTSPLSIKIDQKFTIPEEFLVLTKNVRDYEVEVTMNLFTENKSGGSGTIHNSLKVGDKVILLREQGGQKYIVLDKVGD